MNQPIVAYWPVACELARSPKGARIIVGTETAIACDGVIQHVKKSWGTSLFQDYVVLPAAGVSPDPQWEGKEMCFVMRDYLLEGGIPYENLEPLIGQTFNTEGEARAIVSYLLYTRSVRRVVICVKWWHALRCYAWLQLLFWKFKIQNVEIEVVPLHTQVEPKDIWFEFWKAAPFNLIRMLRVRYME